MHLSSQFFGKENDNERHTQQGKEHNRERHHTSQYIEIEVAAVVYPVYLYQPTEKTVEATEIIKNLINRNTRSCKTLANEPDWSYNESSLNRFESARKGDL